MGSGVFIPNGKFCFFGVALGLPRPWAALILDIRSLQ